jgi:hypothetical protein
MAYPLWLIRWNHGAGLAGLKTLMALDAGSGLLSPCLILARHSRINKLPILKAFTS